MELINLIIDNKLNEAKELIYNILQDLANECLDKYKEDINSTLYPLHERSPNIIKLGRVKKYIRRIRRDKSGNIVLQRGAQRSALSGYRLSGHLLKRISAVQKFQKAQNLRRAWKTKRRASLNRALLKRNISLRRRKSLGIR